MRIVAVLLGVFVLMAGVGAEGPRGLGVTADGALLVTANDEAGNLSVIDRASGKLLRHIPIGKNPEFVRVRGDYAFVSFEPAAKAQPTSPRHSKPVASVGADRDMTDRPRLGDTPRWPSRVRYLPFGVYSGSWFPPSKKPLGSASNFSRIRFSVTATRRPSRMKLPNS